MEQIKERKKYIKEGKDYGKLVIFCEGTTNNGHSLLDFKKGAFILDDPNSLTYDSENPGLRVIGIKYKGRISASMNMVSSIESLIGTLCNLYNRAEVFECDKTLVYNKEFDWEKYALAIRKFMVDEYGFEDTGGNYQDYKEFRNQYLRLKKNVDEVDTKNKFEVLV